MKVSCIINLISLLFMGAFLSCKEDDEGPRIESIDQVKIDSVVLVNDTMTVHSVQSIRTYSAYKAGCEGFYGYDYQYTSDFDRAITAYRYKSNVACKENSYNGASQLNFSPKKAGTYILKFYNGDNNWIIKSVVVQ